MEFYLNELSLQGQFPSLDGFYSTFSDLMRMRFVLRSVGKELYCSRKFEYMRVFADVSLREAVQRLSRDQQRVVLPWVRQNGPFWDDSRLHTEDDYIECLGHVVTGTGLAEAASIAEAGIMTSVVSASPSVWEVSPLIVRWRQDDHSDFENMIENYWTLNSLQSSLTREPTPLRTWDDLESECRKVCSQLTFSDDAFEPLHGHPFIPAAAKRILFLLKQLQDLKEPLNNTLM